MSSESDEKFVRSTEGGRECLACFNTQLAHFLMEALKASVVTWKEFWFTEKKKNTNIFWCCLQVSMVKSRENLKEHCCHSNLQFLILYLGEIKFFSKIFVQSWIYLHSSQINGSKLAISTERRSVNKMSFLSGVSLNFVENSIVCAKFGSGSTSSQVVLANGWDSCQAVATQVQTDEARTGLEWRPASHLNWDQFIYQLKHELMVAWGWLWAAHWSRGWPEVNSSVHLTDSGSKQEFLGLAPCSLDCH